MVRTGQRACQKNLRVVVHLLAVDLDAGTVAWRYQHPERKFPFYASPAVGSKPSPTTPSIAKSVPERRVKVA